MTEVVYFFGAPTAIKIGRTANLETRFQAVRALCPDPLSIIAVVPGGADLERGLHRHLADHRINGEWFSDCAQVRTAIDQVKRGELGAINIQPRSKPSSHHDLVRWASGVLKEIAEPRLRGESTKAAIERVAAVVGLSYWRTFDLWYAKARRLEIAEHRSISAAQRSNQARAP